MNLLLFIIPVIFLGFGALLMYKFHGKRSLFKIDLVQIIYIFLLVPFLFVSSKTFLYQILRENGFLSMRDMFAIDTLYSTVFLFFTAAMTIHGITKTYSLRARSSEEFDWFHLTEYLHLWWSHLALFGAGLLLMTFLSLTNIFFPIDVIETNRMSAVVATLLGVPAGTLIFFSVWVADPKQGRFMFLMKMLFSVMFLVHAIAYLKYRPSFDSSFVGYWLVTSITATLVIASMWFERSSQIQKWKARFVPKDWGIDNLQVKK